MFLPLLALAAAPSVPLKPIGPWNVEAAANFCMLSRSYGGEKSVVVGFQPVERSDVMDVLVVTPLGGRGSEAGDATVTRLPNGKTWRGAFHSTPNADGSRRVTRITVSRELYDTLDQAGTIRVAAGRIETEVAIAGFAKAAPVFRSCEDDLLTRWDIDPATVRTGIPPKPTRSVYDFIRPIDYPRAALAGGYVGRVRAMLRIDAQGRATDCRVVAAIGRLFDQTTCERARLIPFTPGRGPTGEAAPSIYVLSVAWSSGIRRPSFD